MGTEAMDVKLWVTSECLPGCPTCQGNDGPQGSLTSAGGQAILDFLLAQPNVAQLHILFLGGEPLLEAQALQEIIEYGLRQAPKSRRAIAFTVLTNGLNLSESWLRFCRERGVQLLLHVCAQLYLGDDLWPVKDGQPETPLSPLLPLEKAAAQLAANGYDGAQVTVRPGHVTGLPQLIRALVKQGLRTFDVEADQSQTWSPEEWGRLCQAYNDLSDLYLDQMQRDQPLRISFIEEKLRTGVRRKPLAHCGAGTERIVIDPQGRIYGCLENGVDREKMRLGDVAAGFQPAAVEWFRALSAAPEQESCQICSLGSRCYHRCLTLNLALTGDPTQVPRVACDYEQLIVAIADRVGSKLYRDKTPAFFRRYYRPPRDLPTIEGHLTLNKSGERPAFGLQWHVTARCNQQCTHCYMLDSPTYASEIANEMPFDTFARILDDFVGVLRRWQLGGHINFTGGDPLLREDFFDILAYTHAKPEIKHINLLGNPYLVTPETARRMRDNGVRFYQISIDGLEKTHDAMRRPGSFRDALRALGVLRQAGIATAIMFTLLGKSNVHELLDVIQLAVDHHVDHFAFDRVVPIGRGQELDDEWLSAQEFRDLLHRVAQEYRRLGGQGTEFARKSHLWKLYYREYGLLPPLPADKGDVIYSGCAAGYNSLAILADGTVYPCRRLPITVGKFPEQRFEELFTESQALDEIRNIQGFEKCGRCDLLQVCRGCPAVARAVTGSNFGPDPHCWLTLP